MALLFPLVLALGIAAVIGTVASFKHATLLSFVYGFYALVCLGAWYLRTVHSPAAKPLAAIAVILLLVAAIEVARVQAPARRCTTPSRIDWIVVLGCRLIDGKPGRTLTRRLTTALECYRQHPRARLMVCGGKGDDESCTEAQAMVDFLVAQGLSAAEITMEDQSRTTAENLRNFLEITHDPHASIVLVTSDFHMGRALSLAHQQGFTKVTGLPSKTPWTSWLNCSLREAIILGAQRLGFRPSNVSIGRKRL